MTRIIEINSTPNFTAKCYSGGPKRFESMIPYNLHKMEKLMEGSSPGIVKSSVPHWSIGFQLDF